jgi:hypothetical protein
MDFIFLFLLLDIGLKREFQGVINAREVSSGVVNAPVEEDALVGFVETRGFCFWSVLSCPQQTF